METVGEGRLMVKSSSDRGDRVGRVELKGVMTTAEESVL